MYQKDDVVFVDLTPDQKERVQTFLEEFFQQKAREEEEATTANNMN